MGNFPKATLIRSSRKVKRVLKNVYPTFYISPENIITRSNKHANEMFGTENLEGLNIRNFIPHTQQIHGESDKLLSEFGKLFQGEDNLSIVWEFYDKIGSTIWTDLVVLIVKIESNISIEVHVKLIDKPSHLLSLAEEISIANNKLETMHEQVQQTEMDHLVKLIEKFGKPEHLKTIETFKEVSIEVSKVKLKTRKYQKKISKMKSLENEYEAKADIIAERICKKLSTKLNKLHFTRKKIKKMAKNEEHSIRRIINNLRMEKKMKVSENEILKEGISNNSSKLKTLSDQYNPIKGLVHQLRKSREYSLDNFLLQRLKRQLLNSKMSIHIVHKCMNKPERFIQSKIDKNKRSLSIYVENARSFAREAMSQATLSGQSQVHMDSIPRLFETITTYSDTDTGTDTGSTTSVSAIERFPSLDTLLNNKMGISYFRLFLSRRMEVEYLLFALNIRQLENASPEVQKIWNESIINTFIASNSLFEIDFGKKNEDILELRNPLMVKKKVYKFLNKRFKEFTSSDLFFKVPAHHHDTIYLSKVSGNFIDSKSITTTLNSAVLPKSVNEDETANQIVRKLVAQLISLIDAYYSPSQQNCNCSRITSSLAFKRFIVDTAKLRNIKFKHTKASPRRVAFCINLFNLISLHAAIIHEPPHDIGSYEGFMLNASYDMDGERISLSSILMVLTSSTTDPRIPISLLRFKDGLQYIKTYRTKTLDDQLDVTFKIWIERNVVSKNKQVVIPNIVSFIPKLSSNFFQECSKVTNAHWNKSQKHIILNVPSFSTGLTLLT